MNVAELIEKLKQYPPEMLVLQDVGNGEIETVTEVYEIEVQEHRNYEIFPRRTPYFWTEFYEIKDREKITAIAIG